MLNIKKISIRYIIWYNNTHGRFYMQKIVKPLLKWYYQNKRDLPWRKHNDPYHIWISEIMLQQTQVETVIPFYLRFIKELPNIKQLAQVDDERLMKLWEGLGYYSRARNLKIAANQIIDIYHGEFPKSYDAIIKLKGIGPYTAGAIASIAYNEKQPAVDGNVLRVYSRINNSYLDIANQKTQQLIATNILKILPKQVGDFNQALMELGATICGYKKMQCNECPINKHCLAFKNNTQNELPVKLKKIKRQSINKTFMIFKYQNEIALQKNQQKTVFHNMWQLPMVDEHLTKTAIIEKYPCISIKKLPSSKHVFTHMDWHIEAYLLEMNNKDSQFEWKSIESIKEDIALATVYRKYIEPMVILQEDI